METRFNLEMSSSAQKDFWKHLHKECVLEIVNEKQRKGRKDLLLALQEDVRRGRYKPAPLIGKLSSQKSKGVPRFVPVFEPTDYSVYFGCAKIMDRTLAKHAVPNTFGGWTLGGERKRGEEQQMKLIFTERLGEGDAIDIGDDYFPGSAYTRYQWFKNWQQFWRLLDMRFADGRYPVIATFDIANFYDSIELPLLDRDLRSACPAHSGAIDVLGEFLRSWDSEHRPYEPKLKGLPQDVVGDCSRVYANFFLTPFDREMERYSAKRGAEYVRWADDAYIGCSSRRVAEDLIYFATEHLNMRGLSISSQKVDYYSTPELNANWHFDILEQGDAESFETGLELLDAAWATEFGRLPTCFKMALSKVVHTEVDPRWRPWIRDKIVERPDLLMMFGEAQFKNLIRVYDNSWDLLTQVIKPVHSSRFTSTKASLLRAITLHKIPRHYDVLTSAEKIMREELAKTEDSASLRLADSYWGQRRG